MIDIKKILFPSPEHEILAECPFCGQKFENRDRVVEHVSRSNPCFLALSDMVENSPEENK